MPTELISPWEDPPAEKPRPAEPWLRRYPVSSEDEYEHHLAQKEWMGPEGAPKKEWTCLMETHEKEWMWPAGSRPPFCHERAEHVPRRHLVSPEGESEHQLAQKKWTWPEGAQKKERTYPGRIQQKASQKQGNEWKPLSWTQQVAAGRTASRAKNGRLDRQAKECDVEVRRWMGEEREEGRDKKDTDGPSGRLFTKTGKRMEGRSGKKNREKVRDREE
ncbi:uncharacterized protein BO72DRAFT_498892 [Aspergillus fijiensis CBS 313.89]|uniref:Uncharacterized protein n=1 Tax=Aspergillus fijiensis CBS 313.89 TaxID=1448319 RepID=A0A8G1VZ52_9EURO|nr:uncharacterized protein BO72DRAFT_498892 [Aspergillus fijiensis CBS 313.89]RAK74674.1 hypothetical protein BO72DRAFT_498892 [Aspergillus fijiensis CBS 313.89]